MSSLRMKIFATPNASTALDEHDLDTGVAQPLPRGQAARVRPSGQAL
jgi:hypothetical protein